MGLRRVTVSTAIVAATVSVLLVGQQQTPGGVTAQDLLEGLANPTRWQTFAGDYTGRRHSPLTQISPENVHRLTAQWTFQTGGIPRGRGFESTPLVVDGVIYLTGSFNYGWALDARTGRP